MARQERSAGFVICYRPPDPGELRFLLLDYGKHWDFPKGHVEKGEDDLTAALRELREETGITQLRIISEFQHEIIYFFRDRRGQLIRKVVVFFLGEISSDKVVLSEEHVGYEFLQADDALARVTYATAKQLIRIARQQLDTSTTKPGQDVAAAGS